MDWSWVVAGVVGWLVGILTAFLAPVQRWSAKLGRRAFRDRGVHIAVQTDVDAIFAGMPDWVTFRSFRPGVAPLDGPPPSRSGWQSWNVEAGGNDYGSSVIAISIVAEGDATVVMRPPNATVHAHDPAGQGVVLARYVGGASISPLGFDIELDSHPEMAVLTDADGVKVAPPLRWSLRKGDVHTVLLRVHCGTPGRWRWSARLPFLVEGRPIVKAISGPRGPFVLVGTDDRRAELVWNGHEWQDEGAANS